MNRETWLSEATRLLKESLFKDAGYTFPDVKVSVGFTSRPKRSIGQYWHADASSDKVPQIFISPVLGTPLTALETLVHELCHACTPGEKHNKVFGKCARAVGLEGKLRATHAGDKLKATLLDLAEAIGPYPQATLNFGETGVKGKQALFKVICKTCHFHARITPKFVEEGLLPMCPEGEQMELA